MTNEPVLGARLECGGEDFCRNRSLREQDFLHPAELMRRLMLEHPGLRARLVPYRAVGVSQGLLLAVRCERKGKDGKFAPALAAFSPTPVSSGGDYEALTGGACMKLELRKLLQMLGVLQPEKILYIGGSDVLPPPLPPEPQEQHADRRVWPRASEHGTADAHRAQSAAWSSISHGALKTPASTLRISSPSAQLA